MGILRTIVALSIAASVLLVGPSAGADCGLPSIDYEPIAVARGEVIHVEGTSFGGSCHDTGPPPPGEGVLGMPLADIEVVISQGTQELVVAVGSADGEYAFATDVVVPATLLPGPATLTVRIEDRLVQDRTNQPLTISESPPDASPPDQRATFGPPTMSSLPGSAGSPARTSEYPSVGLRNDGTAGLAWHLALGVGAIGAGVVVVAGFARLRPRSRQESVEPEL